MIPTEFRGPICRGLWCFSCSWYSFLPSGMLSVCIVSPSLRWGFCFCDRYGLDVCLVLCLLL